MPSLWLEPTQSEAHAVFLAPAGSGEAEPASCPVRGEDNLYHRALRSHEVGIAVKTPANLTAEHLAQVGAMEEGVLGKLGVAEREELPFGDLPGGQCQDNRLAPELGGPRGEGAVT